MEIDAFPLTSDIEVANEVVGLIPGATMLISSSAIIDVDSNPNTEVPNTLLPNLGTIGAATQGGSDGINGTIAWYAELDTASITLEYWARTGENTATMISRRFSNDGIVIDDPQDLDISYYVLEAGVPTEYQLIDVADMSPGGINGWHHYAFTYDKDTGTARFFVDDVEVASRTEQPNSPLIWSSSADLIIGDAMDFASGQEGTMDELHITDRAIDPVSFLTSPEPGTGILLLSGLVGLAARRRR